MTSNHAIAYEQTTSWPRVATRSRHVVSSLPVLRGGLPVLRVVHFSGDDTWAFTCGQAQSERAAVATDFEAMVSYDKTLKAVLDLPAGWGACRDRANGPWKRYPLLNQRDAAWMPVDLLLL